MNTGWNEVDGERVFILGHTPEEVEALIRQGDAIYMNSRENPGLVSIHKVLYRKGKDGNYCCVTQIEKFNNSER